MGLAERRLPVALAVKLALTETVKLAGVVKPLTVAKAHGMLPTVRPATDAPLGWGTPPSPAIAPRG